MTRNEIKAIVKAAGGSTLTRESRAANLAATGHDLRHGLNIQIKSFSGLRQQHLSSLVSFWKEQGMSTRTIQNKLAHVRAALRCLGREKFADSALISNRTLGAYGASRGGSHTTPDKETIEQRISALPDGFKEAAQLQLTLGLRAQEAIQCNKSLGLWEKQLLEGRRVTVLHGTKGGKGRDLLLLTENAKQKALEAVRAAIEARDRHGGTLIHSSSLEGANRAYQRAMNKVGFKGSEASHSLRYHFAQAQYGRYLEAGFGRHEALSSLSLDLGHGDGRGRYCAQVYLKGCGA